MKIIKKENKLCLVCMEDHEVKTVVVKDMEEFKGEEVSFDSIYEYCDRAEEYLEDENMIKANSLAMKDAYREKVGLLNSSEIVALRNKYDVSQKDFSDILGWGKATITRYENHQVQDRAHDDVLRKIDSDPQWFIEMLKRAKGEISSKAFNKYLQKANLHFQKAENKYLVNSIQALYTGFVNEDITGGVELNLDKVVEVINYFADKVHGLYKVKLMKMLWYADSLSCKRTGKAITGLVYNALPMGAVPEGHYQIMKLKGIEYDTEVFDDNFGYRFKPAEGFEIKKLVEEEIQILKTVIANMGHLNSQDIIEKMHSEEAFRCTESKCVIPFAFAEKLSLD